MIGSLNFILNNEIKRKQLTLSGNCLLINYLTTMKWKFMVHPNQVRMNRVKFFLSEQLVNL